MNDACTEVQDLRLGVVLLSVLEMGDKVST